MIPIEQSQYNKLVKWKSMKADWILDLLCRDGVVKIPDDFHLGEIRGGDVTSYFKREFVRFFQNGSNEIWAKNWSIKLEGDKLKRFQSYWDAFKKGELVIEERTIPVVLEEDDDSPGRKERKVKIPSFVSRHGVDYPLDPHTPEIVARYGLENLLRSRRDSLMAHEQSLGSISTDPEFLMDMEFIDEESLLLKLDPAITERKRKIDETLKMGNDTLRTIENLKQEVLLKQRYVKGDIPKLEFAERLVELTKKRPGWTSEEEVRRAADQYLSVFFSGLSRPGERDAALGELEQYTSQLESKAGSVQKDIDVLLSADVCKDAKRRLQKLNGLRDRNLELPILFFPEIAYPPFIAHPRTNGFISQYVKGEMNAIMPQDTREYITRTATTYEFDRGVDVMALEDKVKRISEDTEKAFGVRLKPRKVE